MRLFTMILLCAAAPCALADAGMSMPAALGSYPMTREASGTSWQPDATPMQGVMTMGGDWMTMVHGYVNQVYDHQGGPRGGMEDFSNSMLMLMADRSWG